MMAMFFQEISEHIKSKLIREIIFLKFVTKVISLFYDLLHHVIAPKKISVEINGNNNDDDKNNINGNHLLTFTLKAIFINNPFFKKSK